MAPGIYCTRSRFLPEMGATSLLNTTFVREPVNGGLNFIVAVGWGLLSALSLVIGAWIGITQADTTLDTADPTGRCSP